MRRTLVDLADLGITVELLRRKIFGEAVAPEDFQRLRGHPLAHLRAEIFGHRRLPHEGLTALFQASGVVHHQPARLDLGSQLGKLELDRLEVSDGPTELPSLLSIG